MNDIPEPTLNINVEKIAAWFGVVASASIVASIVFEFSYLRTLGLGFAQVPIGLPDLTKTAILWLPLSIPFWLSNLFSHASNLEEATVKIRDSETIKTKPFYIRIFYNPLVHGRIIAFLCILAYVIHGDSHKILFLFGLMIIIIEVVATVIYKSKLSRHFKHPAHGWILTVTIFLCTLYTLGYSSAASDLASKKFAEIDVGEAKPLKLRVLRIYDSGYLVSAKNVSFLQKDIVKSVTYPIRPASKVGLPCYYLSRLCPQNTDS